jgi:hypothetical protein
MSIALWRLSLFKKTVQRGRCELATLPRGGTEKIPSWRSFQHLTGVIREAQTDTRTPIQAERQEDDASA